jgi:nifR3 family TIM-barrel protein
MSVKISDKISFDHLPIVLAPMEGVTNLPFRKICKDAGADIVYTEFTSSEAITRGNEKTLEKMVFDEDERPLGIQVFGAEAEVIKQSALDVIEKYDPDIIDINCGCPVSKVTAKGCGAGFLKDLNAMEHMAKTVVDAVLKPVTIKMRLGWDLEHIVVEEAVKRLEQAGIRQVTIHARTRSQMYKGKADWEWLKKAKDATPNLPIFGNGDVTSPELAKKMLDETAVDGIMIGRGAIDNPWIFDEIKHYLKTGERKEMATLSKRIDTLIQQIKMSEKVKGADRTGIEIRKYYSGYLRGFDGVKKVRSELMQLRETSAIVDRLFEFKAKINSL